MERTDLPDEQKRTVKAYGALSRKRLERIRGEVVRLLAESDRPVAILINSPGGKIDFLSTFGELLTPSKTRGAKPPIITEVHEQARSSAAYLLILGDYACALPSSKLHLHGVKYRSGAKLQCLAAEEAALMALRLDRQNRLIAKKMSERIAARLAVRQREWARQIAVPPRDAAKRLHSLVQFLAARIVAEKNRQLLREVAEHFQSLYPQWTWMKRPGGGRAGPPVIDQTASLKKWVAGQFQEFAAGGGAGDIVSSLGRLIDFAHVHAFASLEFPSGVPVAESLERQQLQCFAFALSWRLLFGENALSPEDAYWLGLIDEVTGTALAGTRPA
ncbi:MAG TPA: ATP-dependent Clp protease proteolytic subunit [Opitutales bacterium]|nr:ATP-dependent Clp protease proteolytic subunit [Opitutales bacterium]